MHSIPLDKLWSFTKPPLWYSYIYIYIYKIVSVSAPSFQFSGSGGPEPAKHGRNWSPSSRWSVNFPQYHVSLKGCGRGWKLALGQGWQKENASKPAAFQRRKKQHKQRNMTWLYHCPPKWMFILWKISNNTMDDTWWYPHDWGNLHI